MQNNDANVSIDIRDVLRVLKKRAWIIILLTAITVGISLLTTIYVFKPIYKSQISIVIGKDQTIQDNLKYDYNDIMMYQNLIKTYAQIAKSRSVALKTIDKLNLTGLSPEELEDDILVTPQADTLIMDISVRNADPLEAKNITDAVADSFIEESKRILLYGNIQIIDSAMVPKYPVSPNKKQNVLLGFFIGICISGGLIAILEHMDNSIRTENDVQKYLDIPVFGVILLNTK